MTLRNVTPGPEAGSFPYRGCVHAIFVCEPFDSLAVAIPSADEDDIGSGQLSFVASLSLNVSSFCHTISGIVSRRSDKQVGWVNAFRVVAGMADAFAGWYRSFVERVGKAMGFDDLPLDGQDAISVGIASAKPFVAARRGWADIGQKTVLNGAERRVVVALPGAEAATVAVLQEGCAYLEVGATMTANAVSHRNHGRAPFRTTVNWEVGSTNCRPPALYRKSCGSTMVLAA